MHSKTAVGEDDRLDCCIREKSLFACDVSDNRTDGNDCKTYSGRSGRANSIGGHDGVGVHCSRCRRPASDLAGDRTIGGDRMYSKIGWQVGLSGGGIDSTASGLYITPGVDKDDGRDIATAFEHSIVEDC